MRVQPQITAPWSEPSGRECGERADQSVVILGLGNVLLGDDGAGIHVIERLRLNPALPAEVLLVDGGTLSFSLLELLENARILVVVDAMDLDAAPGTVRLFVDDELDRFLAAPKQRSVHDANLGDLLRMCALLGTLPGHRVLVGIQPETIEWNAGLSDWVSAGINVACNRISLLMEEWT